MRVLTRLATSCMKVSAEPASREPAMASCTERSSAQGATEEQVMIAGRLEPGGSNCESNLRPVPGLVHEDVEEQFARRHRPLLVAYLERPYLVGNVLVQIGGVLFQLAAHRGSIIEQGRDVGARQPGTVAERFAPQ